MIICLKRLSSARHKRNVPYTRYEEYYLEGSFFTVEAFRRSAWATRCPLGTNVTSTNN